MSVSESSSFPTLDVPLINLAIRPSNPSISAAKIIAIIARFDQGIVDAPGNVGIDKPAIREAKLIINSDHDTSFVYDLNHNDAAEIVGSFSLYKKGEKNVVTPIPISNFVQEGNIEGIAMKDILLN